MLIPPAASRADPDIISLGCRLNIAESETIRALVSGRDMVVVNSCAVTKEPTPSVTMQELQVVVVEPPPAADRPS